MRGASSVCGSWKLPMQSCPHSGRGCTWILGAVRWGCPGSKVQGRVLGVPLQSLAPSQLSEKLDSADPGSGEQRLEAAPEQLKGEVARGGWEGPWHPVEVGVSGYPEAISSSPQPPPSSQHS